MLHITDVDIVVYGAHPLPIDIVSILADKLSGNLRYGTNPADPRFLVSGSDAGSVRVWNLESGTNEVIHRTKSREKVYCVRHLHDTVIASATATCIIIWDYFLTEPVVKILTGHKSYVYTLERLSNFNLLSGGGKGDCTVRVWQYPNYECTHVLTGHTDTVICLAIIDDATIASASADESIRIWDLTTGTCNKVLTGHDGNINCLCYLKNNQLLSGGDDNHIRLWDLSTGSCILALNSMQGWVWSLTLARDGYVISSGQYNKLVAIWDIHEGKCVKTLTLQNRGVSGIIQISDFLFARSADDWCIHIWDINSGETVKKLLGHSALIWCVAPILPM